MSVEKNRKIYILLFEGTVLGAWTNLKYLCRDRNTEGVFPSYSKLSKDIAALRNEGNDTPVLSIKTKDSKEYQIKVELVR
ncbi:MAG: hypothetical protein JNL70_09370 [Saprospiraceae bacterium]|nr:hypothetical protein [Saprospiraceae bacterium]